jgi:histidinol-phosphate aminotransferase
MNTSLNRRQWLKAAGATFAAATLAPRFALKANAAATETPALATKPIAGPVQLSLNENPFGPAASAQAAMHALISRSCRYAYKEQGELIAQIARIEGCKPENIVLGAGSGEILDVTGFHYGLQKGEVLSASPSYSQLLMAAEKEGGKAVRVPLNAKLEYDLPAIAAAVNPKTSLIYICNPNNPTGTLLNADELKAFVRETSKKAPVFIDEAYLQCADDFAGHTCAGLVSEGFNVVVARTFSKLYGLAGLRLGYAVMPEILAKEIRAQMTGSLSSLTIAAAKASLEDADYVKVTRAKIKAGREALIATVTALGKEHAVSQTNFVFFKTGMPVQDFIAKMKAEGVIVGRPFSPFLDWARISIGLPEEMAVCHAALKKVLA